MITLVIALLSFVLGFLVGAHYVQWAFKPVHTLVVSLEERYKRILAILTEWQGNATKN